MYEELVKVGEEKIIVGHAGTFYTRNACPQRYRLRFISHGANVSFSVVRTGGKFPRALTLFPRSQGRSFPVPACHGILQGVPELRKDKPPRQIAD